MPLVILALGGLVFACAGAVAVAVGTLLPGWLHARLPPLLIDAAALGGGVTAVGVGLLTVAGAHGAVLIGVRHGATWARTAGVLLAALLTVATGALGVTAVTSAVAAPGAAPGLLGAAALAFVAAVAYGLCVAGLVRWSPPMP